MERKMNYLNDSLEKLTLEENLKQKDKSTYFKKGFRDGIPIALGYIAVSFTFGIAAKNSGLTVFQSVLMSITNLTSAGQFAGVGLIAVSSSYIEMAITQLVINLRYCLMSCSLSQKLDKNTSLIHRFLIATGITDEIFAVSICIEGKLNPFYNYGVFSAAIPGWAIGTLLGGLSGSIFPPRILSALSVALYGMFIAIIIPPAKKDKIILAVVIISMALSFLFTKLPILNEISSGFRIIILTTVIAGGAAILFPLKEDINES
ncbi:AzlC family ABC transporter permease [Clostridium nigeriense]|uniref:AzlC family ABC transporter permease n=1 Tax=Clostridium nigeriense TaxID=1805470 RepID=UPI000B0DC9D7|nr:AzlC family ABC transporter permease [Clostridium nigeriense]